MENNTVVYRHVRLDTNEVFYVGIGNDKRPYQKTGRNKWWNRITDKVNYKVDILFSNLTWNEACTREIGLIEFYGRKDLGLGTLVNMTDGGDGAKGAKRSKETKTKLSIIANNRSDETKLKMSEGSIGILHSEETKKKIRDNAPNRRAVLQLDTSDNIIKEWSSLRCVSEGGYTHQHVYRVCNGKRKLHKGYKWKYKDV